MISEPWHPGADEPIDELDELILNDIRTLYQSTDPVPEHLAERVCFALDLVGLEDEIAHLQTAGLEPVGVRGAEQSRTITFDSESLTIVVQVSRSGDTMRVDGWLAPPAVHRVRLRAGDTEFQTESDELGRFVVLEVPHGLVQIVVEGGGASQGEPERTVITPAVVL